MPDIRIITNPNSKANKLTPGRINQLSDIVNTKAVLDVSNSLNQLETIIKNHLVYKPKIVVIDGGDGTVSRILSAAYKFYNKTQLPSFVLLGGGTMNVLANDLGIRGCYQKKLKRLLEMNDPFTSLKTLTRTSIIVENNVGFLYADGSSLNILNEFYRDKKGHFEAFCLGARIIFSALHHGQLYQSLIKGRPITFLPKPQTAALHHNSLSTIVASISKLPLNIPLLMNLKNFESKLQAISITSSAKNLLWHFPFILLNNKEGESIGKFHFLCDELEIRGEDPFSYTLDGEVYSSESNVLSIRRGPKINFLV
ncbi:MAG: hypothetical protein HQK54_04205 [Oligoflexales bacterium]|nr:hypothetical protein [Oligoflexales bacterium]